MRKILFLLVILFAGFFVNAQVPDSDVSLAKGLVSKNLTQLGISSADLENSLVSSTYMSGPVRLVYLQQTFRDLPVYNEMQVLAFREQQLVSAAGSRIKNIQELVNVPGGVPSVDIADGVRAALAEANIQAKQGIIILDMKNRKFNFGRLGGIVYEDVTAELIWVPVDNKEVRLAWQVFVAPQGQDDMWLIRVDAQNRTILGKDNLTTYDHWSKDEVSLLRAEDPAPKTWIDREKFKAPKTPIINGASYLVIKYPAESPTHPGGTATVHTDPWTMAGGNATTLKWHSDGTTDYNISRGNNVWATEDRLATNQNTGLPATSSTPDPLTFNFPPDYTVPPTNPTFQQFAITNLFYWNNIMHDITYIYGFDEVGGNFQKNNQGRGGLGNDDVMALAQSGAGTNNANFSTPVDGQRGRMRMYLWTAPNPDRDGDLDNGIIAHEFGHGVSNRLTGGPGNSSCVQNAEHGGEGWSDYFGLMVTTDWSIATPADGPIARGIGTYALNQPPSGTGIRTFPYSTNLAINPRIYSATLPTAVHTRGEYWCAALWEMTWEMIQLDGINPNLFNPAGTGGNSAAMKLVIEGMKLQPCGPGFIDARNAILKADTLFFGAHYSCAIWKAFAKRGMGRNASQGSANSVTDQIPSFIVDNGLFRVNETAPGVPEGQNVTYTNVVTAGTCSPMNNYFVTDTLPTHVTWVSGGSYNAGNRTVTLGPVNLTPGQSQNFPFTVNINVGSYFSPVTHFNEQVTGATIPSTWTAFPGSGNTWTVSSTQSYSPPNAFFAINPAVSSDMTLGTNIDYSLAPNTAANYSTLSFWHSFNTEEGWDGGVVEISTNGGSNWTDLGSQMITGKYNGSLGTGSALANRQAFTGNSSGFINTTINLSSYAGQNVRIRFRFASDNNTAPAGGGWFVDDVKLLTEPAVYMKSNLFNSSSQLQSVTDTVTKILPTGCTPITITGQPSDNNACAGGNANFTVVTTGTSPVFQWQVNDGSGFVNVPTSSPYTGSTTSTLTITGVTSGMNGYQYRCIVSNGCPSSVTSNSATLSVGATASIQAQPANVTACAGTNTSFTVNATNAGSFQWQVNNGSGFVNVPAAAPYSGGTTATLTITGITGSMNNYQYRVVIGSCPANINSSNAILTVTNPVSFSAQPQSVDVCENSTANFSVTASGSITGYQWQVSTDGGSNYTNISGATTSALAVPSVTLALDGNLYRCVVSGSCGNVTSGAALLTVNASPFVTLGTIPASLCVSDTAITLTATPGGGTWSGTGIQGITFSPTLAGTGTSNITYTVTNTAGCTTSSSRAIQVNECPERHVTLDRPNSLIIYANPNNGRFNVWVRTDLYTRLGLRVYNSKGQLVQTNQFTGLYYNRIVPVDMSRFPAGVYQLYFYNTETGKLIKRTIGMVISR